MFFYEKFTLNTSVTLFCFLIAGGKYVVFLKKALPGFSLMIFQSMSPGYTFLEGKSWKMFSRDFDNIPQELIFNSFHAPVLFCILHVNIRKPLASRCFRGSKKSPVTRVKRPL